MLYSKYVIVSLFSLLAVICLLLAGLDICIGSIAQSWTELTLSQQSQDNLESIETDVATLRDSIAALEGTLAQARKLSIPSPQDIRQLARSHGVSVRRLEQINRGQASEDSRHSWYRLQIVGSVGAVVRYLSGIDHEFVLKTDNLRLVAADKEGRRVALTALVILES